MSIEKCLQIRYRMTHHQVSFIKRLFLSSRIGTFKMKRLKEAMDFCTFFEIPIFSDQYFNYLELNFKNL